MIDTTDLQAVKQIAIQYLKMPIKPSKSPIGIKPHPVATAAVDTYMENGEMQIAVLEPGSAAYDRWVSKWENIIDESTTAFDVFMIINKEYKYAFMKQVSPYLNQHDFTKIFSWAWTSTENPNMNPNASVKQNVTYFKMCDPTVLMAPEELSVFNNLPETCTVYRGVTPYNQNKVKVLSWTLNEDTAKWFATRYHQSGQVYSATIQKEHVLAYFCCRQEEELVVDPKYLHNIELHMQFVDDDEDDDPVI